MRRDRGAKHLQTFVAFGLIEQGMRGVKLRVILPARNRVPMPRPPAQATGPDVRHRCTSDSGAVVDFMQDGLQIESRVGVRRTERNGDARKALPQTQGPNPGARTRFTTTYQDAVVAPRQILDGHALAATQQVDFHEMSRAGQNLVAFRQVLLSIGPRPLVGRTEQFDHGDQLPVSAVANLHERYTLAVHLREVALHRGIQHRHSESFAAGRSMSNRNIAPAQEPRLLAWQFVDVDVLVDLDDVSRINLRGNQFRHERYEPLVEIVPRVLLFEIRIHSRKWRRHDFIIPSFLDAGHPA